MMTRMRSHVAEEVVVCCSCPRVAMRSQKPFEKKEKERGLLPQVVHSVLLLASLKLALPGFPSSWLTQLRVEQSFLDAG